MTPLQLEEVAYTFGENTVSVLQPEEKATQLWFNANRETNKGFPFPFWAKVWPASIGMCSYLAQNTYLVKGKTVLELAAGLGLPSLLVSAWAEKVYCTDISPEAVATVQKSADRNNINNLQAFTLDWNDVPPAIPQVLLVSDVNYNPEVFEALYKVFVHFLAAGTTIVLATPQRLMAKPFINRLLHFCIFQQADSVTTANENIDITILVLQAPGSTIYNNVILKTPT
jgi:predicted nicotinamide N-methyase